MFNQSRFEGIGNKSPVKEKNVLTFYIKNPCPVKLAWFDLTTVPNLHSFALKYKKQNGLHNAYVQEKGRPTQM